MGKTVGGKIGDVPTPFPNTSFTAAIANGQQQSAVVDMGGFVLCGLYIPAAFTGTALTFQVCTTTGGTFVDLIDGSTGLALTKTVAAGKYLPLDPADFVGVRFLKIKSGSVEGGARTLTLSGRTL